jgi:hypothetical protein
MVKIFSEASTEVYRVCDEGGGLRNCERELRRRNEEPGARQTKETDVEVNSEMISNASLSG